MTLCEFIKQKRIQREKTQKEMAEALGYRSKSSYNQLENGQTTLTVDLLWKILNILELDKDEIENLTAIFFNHAVHESKTNDNILTN